MDSLDPNNVIPDDATLYGVMLRRKTILIRPGTRAALQEISRALPASLIHSFVDLSKARAVARRQLRIRGEGWSIDDGAPTATATGGDAP